MRTEKHRHEITVTVTDNITLQPMEAAFLRVMAEYCIEKNMAGSNACVRLIDALDAALVPPYHGGPIYGLFEDKP